MTTKRVIQLLRVSTEAQAGEDRAGIPAQRAANASTAKAHGLTIVRTIEMADVSGAAVLRAPEMQELLRVIESPEIEGVVAKEFSRLMRPENYGDFAILQAFAETHTVLYLPEGPMDFRNKTGRLMGTIRAAIAGLEMSEIKERTWAAKESMRRAGKFPSADIILPFGVGYERGAQNWYYKPEAEKVAEVFRRFLSGNTNYDALSEFLGLSRGSVKNILTNPIFTGWRVIDKKRDVSVSSRTYRAGGRQGDRPKVNRTPEEIIRVRVIEDGLVSESDFRQVQRMVEQKATRNLRMRTKVGHFTYNGFLWCAKCGDRLHTFRNQFDRYYYICSNKKRKDAAGDFLCRHSCYQNRDKLEPVLDDLFSTRLTDEGFLQRLFEHQDRQSRHTESRSRMERLQEHLETLGQKRQRVIELFIDGEISREERGRRLGQIEGEMAKTQEMISREQPPTVLSVDAVAELFSPFLEWKMLERENKRQLLSAICPQIRVQNYVVDGVFVALDDAHSDMDSPVKMEPSASLVLPCR
jgi:DNA invertase Pin-like site-specific DNA recombinase